MNNNHLQQGDVLLKRVSSIPAKAKAVKPDNRGIVLAEGEVTGHHHKIKAQKGLKLYSIDSLLYLDNQTGGDVELAHEEHKPFMVGEGIWEVSQVREYDYFLEMARTVID